MPHTIEQLEKEKRRRDLLAEKESRQPQGEFIAIRRPDTEEARGVFFNPNKQLDELLGEDDLEDFIPFDAKFDFGRILQQVESPTETKDKVKLSILYESIANIDPKISFNMMDELNKIVVGEPVTPSSAWGRIKQRYKTGKSQVQLMDLGYDILNGIWRNPELYQESIKNIQKLQSGMSVDQRKEFRAWWEKMLGATAEQLPIMGEALKEAPEGAIAGGLLFGTTATLITGAIPTVGEEAVIPAATLKGITVGAGLKGAMRISQLEAGGMFLELAEMEDEFGNKIDPKIAVIASHAVGAINGAIELGEWAVLLKTFGIGGKVFEKSISKVTRKLFAEGTIKRLVAKKVAQFGVALSAETLQEIEQETTNIVFGELAKELNNVRKGTDFKPISAEDLKARYKEVTIESLRAFGLIVAPGTIISGAVEAVDQAKAKKAEAKPVTQAVVTDVAEKFDISEEKAKAILERQAELQATPTEAVQAPQPPSEAITTPEGEIVAPEAGKVEGIGGDVSKMSLEALKEESEIFDKKIETEEARLDKIDPTRQILDASGVTHLSQEDVGRMSDVNAEIGRRESFSKQEAAERVQIKRQLRERNIAFEKEQPTEELKALLTPTPEAKQPTAKPSEVVKEPTEIVSEKEGKGKGKQPWEMTKSEWESKHTAAKPEIAQSNLTRASGSEAVRKFEEAERLRFGVHKEAGEKLRRASLPETDSDHLPMTPEVAKELLDEINTPISHRMVIEKALSEGKPVPTEVLAEYPDLQPTEKVKKVESTKVIEKKAEGPIDKFIKVQKEVIPAQNKEKFSPKEVQKEIAEESEVVEPDSDSETLNATNLMEGYWKQFDVRELEINVAATKNQEAIAKALGKKQYLPESDTETNKISQAMMLYIDLKEHPSGNQFAEQLSSQKKEIYDLSKNLPKNIQKIADNIIEQNRRAGALAIEKGVIENARENYIAHIWEKPTRQEALRARFRQTTARAKKRTLEGGIMEGWSKGLKLRVDDVTLATQIAQSQINQAIVGREMLNLGKKWGLLSDKQAENWVKVEHPGFTTWKWAGKAEKAKTYGRNFFVTEDGNLMERVQVYAEPELGKVLNNIFAPSGLYGKGQGRWASFIETLTRYNAQIKTTILFTSLYHHQAYLRSYAFGGRGLDPVKAYKQGRQSIMNMEPEVRLLVRNGLTIGKIQDYDPRMIEGKQTIWGKALSTTNITESARKKLVDLRKRQERFLFNKLGPALKVQAAILELKAELKRNQKQLESGEITADEIAAAVGNLINNDFGGLHLGRMGRSQTAQHIFRLLVLAPDWTESNIRSAVQAFAKGETGYLHRMFWGRIAMKGLGATILFNLLLSAFDDDDFAERYKKAWEANRLRWLDVDITPIFKAMGGDDDKRKYFSLLGHFRDPIKFTAHPFVSIKHKGSVVSRIGYDMMTGTDWAGRKFTTLGELTGITEDGKNSGRLVKYSREGLSPIEPSQVPSYVLYEVRSSMPIPMQNLIAFLGGEMDAFDAITKSAGLMTATTHPERGRKAKKIRR